MIKLTRLVYVSRVAGAAELDLPATVADVLKTSRRNNARCDVTGMLLTFGGFFLQALEGPDDRVRSTLARVAADPRHKEVKVLGADFCSARAFGRWAMCANDLSVADDDILRVLGRRGEFMPYQMTSVAALKLLTSIAAIHMRQTDAAA